MTRDLYIDNQRVDLPDGVRFTLTFEIADFGELKPRGSGSNTIKLPKTPRNIAILDNCNFVQVDSQFPYLVHSAYYYEDGWLIFSDATVYMLAITQTDFEIQCVWGNSNEIRRLKALDMGDVEGLGNVNYGADTYALIETGQKTFLGEDIAGELAVTAKGLLSRYTRGLLSVEKAIEALGVKVEKNSFMFEHYIKGLHIFPAINSIKGVSRKEAEGSLNGTICNKYGDLGYITYQNSGLASFEKSYVSIRDDWNNRNVFFIPIFQGVNYIVKANFNIKKSGITEGDENAMITVNAYSGKELLNIIISQYITIKNNTTLSFSFEHEFKNGEQGFTFGIYPERGEVQSYPVMEYTCHVEVVANNGDDYSVTIEMPQSGVDEIDGNLIKFSDVLRGNNAFDFLKSCFENSGAILESSDGIISLFTYNDIANNTSEMLDWSDKLIVINKEDVYNELGTKNYVKYKPSDKYNGYGDGYFDNEIAAALKRENKEFMVNSNFSFTNGTGRMLFQEEGGYVYAIIPMFKKNQEGVWEFSGDGGLWLVQLGSRISVPLINDNGQTIVGGESIYGIPSKQPTFDNIRPYCWSNYIGIQNAYRKVKAVFNLRPQDIAEFNFRQPIYLRQYARSYIVTKINYKHNASLVEMLLIR